MAHYSRADHDYDVAVWVKSVRGRSIEDKMVQHWCLSSTSEQTAKYFAIDLLSEMSLNEIFYSDSTINTYPDVVVDKISDKYGISYDEPIGFNIADREFSYDAFRI